jgi:hypothetical protein
MKRGNQKGKPRRKAIEAAEIRSAECLSNSSSYSRDRNWGYLALPLLLSVAIATFGIVRNNRQKNNASLRDTSSISFQGQRDLVVERAISCGTSANYREVCNEELRCGDLLDCSGLVWEVYSTFGVDLDISSPLKHRSQRMFASAKMRGLLHAEPQRGDVVFWASRLCPGPDQADQIHHVGLVTAVTDSKTFEICEMTPRKNFNRAKIRLDSNQKAQYRDYVAGFAFFQIPVASHAL